MHYNWTNWYRTASIPRPFGDTLMYHVAENYLYGKSVEDWGCGFAWFKHIHHGPYIGIDGAAYNWCADLTTNLEGYTSKSEAIFMRGVLEHNETWAAILTNALSSAEKDFVLVVTTPEGKGEAVSLIGESGIPNIALPWEIMETMMHNFGWKYVRMTYPTHSAFGYETIWYCTKH
jgi:hypothetical protein